MTIRVDANPDRIRVEAPARLADIISLIPGLRAVKGERAWEGPTTAATMIALAHEFRGNRDFEPTEGATKLMQKVVRLKARVELVKSGTVREFDTPDGLDLFEYQPAGTWMLAERKRALLGDDMGTGKTVMALTAARHVGAKLILVVCPSNVKHKWVREAKLWYPEAAAYALDGTKKNKTDVLHGLDAWLSGSPGEQPVIVTVNWESLATLTRIGGFGSVKLTEADLAPGPLNAFEWDCVIADEAHRAKDPKAKQTRALKYVSKKATYRWALTGSPVSNTPSDLWSIGNFYDPDTYGTSSHRWQQRYVDFIDTQWGPKDLGLRGDREDEFTDWFDLGFIRRTKAETGQHRPEIIRDVREIEMTSKQRSAYNRMITDMMTVIDDEFLVANDPLSLLTRLSQIASATPVIEEMKVVALDTPSNKITAMLEILEEMPEEQQVVVFSASRKLVDLAEGELRKKNISFVRITGAEDSKVKDMNAAYFQKGGARIALCTLGAASEGIDLFAADTAIFLNRSYKYIESGVGQQAESRIDRQGQTAERLTYIDLVSIGTVDEAVISALLSKGEMAEQVLRDHTRPLLQKKVTAS